MRDLTNGLMALKNLIRQNQVWSRDELTHLLEIIRLGNAKNHGYCILCNRFTLELKKQRKNLENKK